jgi:16S rRNA (adenine1518-N6/adenine1519-N6)-dimethyltransferase
LPEEPLHLPPLREVIARHGLSARKGLGQHFLFDLNLTGRIARMAGPLESGTTIEIGPGPGGLTRALLAEGAAKVIAIEKDKRCLDALGEIGEAVGARLQVIEADALAQDPAKLGPPPRRIVANLPYNISTALLIGWLRLVASQPDALESLTLMFQKEVAERLVARPRTKSYGRLAVISQWLCEIAPLFDIPPQAFVPPPKVVSTVVRLVPRPAPLAPARFASLEAITAAAFGQRRKMLRQSLRSLGKDTAALIEKAGVQETNRAEDLPVQDFCALARAFDTL